MTLVQRLTREPNLILGVLVSGLSLLVLFGVHLTGDQMAGIGVFVGAIIALVRFIVTPSEEVAAQLKPGKSVPEAGPALETVPNGAPVDVAPVDLKYRG